MASNDLQRQLSLVRYASDSREVVLRHGSSVVVYDAQSKELSLRRTPPTSGDLSECPYCHRPLHEKSSSPSYEANVDEPAEEHGFVDPNYFRMLAHSIPASPSSTRPASPFKQLPPFQTEDVEHGLDQPPPADAEFVGSVPAPQVGDHEIRGSSFVPGYFKSFFNEKRELGRGGRGVVLLVEHMLDGVSLGEFACKRIPVGNDHGWLEKVLVEVQLLQQLIHQNLVSYRHVWLEDARISSFGPSVPCIFILQQYCNAGDLHGYVIGSAQTYIRPEDLKERIRRKSKGQPDVTPSPQGPRKMHFDEIFQFFRQITSGIHHLHTNGYIHRDLKPSNCLLHRTGQTLTVHVSDFGEVQAAGTKRSSTGATGTISYCAPEVLQRESGGQFGNFSTKSDIFSLGMIVYFMCFGHLPYANADEMNDENEDVDKLKAEVSSWNGFDESIRTRPDLPPRLYSFLRRLLSPDPVQRPSTEQILQEIKAGGDIDRPMSPTAELGEASPRITSVETPTRQVSTNSRQRRLSNGLVRPGLSTLGRHRSSEVAHSSTSPHRREPMSESSTSNDSGVVLRTRKVDMPPRSPPPAERPSPRQSKTEPIPSTARLIMPPPPTLRGKISVLIQHPTAVLAFKVMAFGVKLITLTRPCTPYAASPRVFYPLMILSALDFLRHQGLAGSFVLLVMHTTIWLTAIQCGKLCNQRIPFWEEEA